MNKKYMEKFDANKAIDSIVDWIKHYFAESGADATAVIGISGGKDSTVAAALLVRALGPERVLGITMPNGIQADIEDSYTVCKILDIPTMEVNIGPAMEQLTNHIPKDLVTNDRRSIYFTNTPSRLRMTALYGIAGLVGGRVVNTCNFSEDYVGYSTKWGDNVGDFALLANYTVTEVIAIGEALGLPEYLIEKTPSDGMCGLSDEDKLGVTYEELDKYIMDGITPSAKTLAKIISLHKASRHKEKKLPTAPNPFQRDYERRYPHESKHADFYF